MSQTTVLRKLGFDFAALDGKVIEENDQLLSMGAVIAREMVQSYPEGMAYKPAEELKKSAWTIDGRYMRVLEHPETGLLQRSDDVHGRVSEPVYLEDLGDDKKGKGIKAKLTWFKDRTPPEVIDAVKSGTLKDVSIGFTYEEDKTPGEFNGEPYDLMQVNIFLDHVTAPCKDGRCPSPMCGIGVDSITRSTIKIGQGSETTMATREILIDHKLSIDITDAVPLETIEREGDLFGIIEGKEFKITGDPWEETEEMIRSGHNSADKFDPRSMRTIDIKPGIKAVIGCPKGKYNESSGKCEVGTGVQSYLFDKEKFSMAEAKAWFKENVTGETEEPQKEDLSGCPICVLIDQLGIKESVKRLYRVYGSDILRVLQTDAKPRVRVKTTREMISDAQKLRDLDKKLESES